MRKRSLMVRGLVVAGALVTASSVAWAAPAKHKKSRPKATPAASSTADENKDSSDSAPAAPSDTPPAAPAEPSAKPSEEPASKASSSPPEKEVSVAASSSEATPAPLAATSDEAPSDRELEALGRREAARIAAGRVEVAVWASADVARRSFKYSDPVGQQYAPYHLPLAPMVSMGLEAYPFASSELPGLHDLGFRAHFSKAFAVDSTTPEGATINTSWTRFGGEARQRFLISGAHPFELGIAMGVDGSYFDMSTKSVVQGLLPSARTLSVRLALDARLQVVPRFALGLGAGYLAPTLHGAIYDRFRDPHVHGVDGDFVAIVGVVPGLEARASARYTRYFASFKPVLGDALVAGGALDEQFQFGLGVRYAH